MFFFWEKARTENTVAAFPAADPSLGTVTDERVTIDNWDWAFFGQVSVDPLEWLSLTGGLRYSEEKKGLTRRVQNSLVPEAPLLVEFQNDAIFTKWIPMASVALTAPEDLLYLYDLVFADHVMTYFTYSQGFRGGGFNGGARDDRPDSIQPFEPENVESFEWGVKTSMLESAVTTNLSLFWMNQDDMQVPELVAELCPPDDPGCFEATRIIINNAAKAEIKGFELEFNAEPWEGLLLDGFVGYVDARYGSYPNSENALTGVMEDRTGQQIPFISPWQTHLGLQYSLPVPSEGPTWLDGWLTTRLDWSWRSELVQWAPELTELTQDAYHLLNLRIGYSFNDNQSEVAFWSTNLSDARYSQQAIAWPRITGTGVRFTEPPRAFGVEVSYWFR